MLAFFCVQAFSQTISPHIDSFLNSSEYNRIRNGSISGFSDVDFEHSSVFTGTSEGEYVVNIVLGSGGGFDGVIQAILLPSQYNNVLPGNEHYIMILYDYRAYDSSDKTGNIKLVDLNYDDWVPIEMTVASGVMTNLNTQFMPDSIVAKYSYLLKKKDLGNPIYNEETNKAHPCDTNGNGNVSFGECFTCLAGNCFGNQSCATLCGIINIAGQFLIGVQACTVSMAASCVWIAFWY